MKFHTRKRKQNWCHLINDGAIFLYEWKQQNVHQENYNYNKLITNYFFNWCYLTIGKNEGERIVINDYHDDY